MAAKGSPTRSSCGISLEVSSPFVDPAQFDYIVVVGGLLRHSANQIDQVSVEYLRDAARKGVPLVGICTGSFALARAGLMKGYRCCISWFHYRDFIEEFEHHLPVADRLWVVDRDRITCPGGVSVVYLAAHLVELRLGAMVAQKTLHIMQADRGKFGHTSQPAPALEVRGKDDRVSQSLLLMEQNLAQPMPLPEIADKVGVSTRQLERVFKAVTGRGPHAIYMQLRLKHARWLLRSTLSIAAIAVDTGFSDAAHLNKAFRGYFGHSPSQERRQMRDQMGAPDGPPRGAFFTPIEPRIFE